MSTGMTTAPAHYGLFIRPSASDAGEHGRHLCASQPSPFGYALRLTAKGQHMIRAAVLSLGLLRLPRAISWLVVAVIVFSIEGEARGLRAHIGKELLEGAPLLAHLDASAAVSVVLLAFGVVAALKHRCPHLVSAVFGGIARSAVPVSCLQFCRHLSVVATARDGRAASQGLSPNNALRSACTSALPSNFGCAGIKKSGKNRDAPESLARKINEGWHFFNPSAMAHFSKG